MPGQLSLRNVRCVFCLAVATAQCANHLCGVTMCALHAAGCRFCGLAFCPSACIQRHVCDVDTDSACQAQRLCDTSPVQTEPAEPSCTYCLRHATRFCGECLAPLCHHHQWTCAVFGQQCDMNPLCDQHQGRAQHVCSVECRLREGACEKGAHTAAPPVQAEPAEPRCTHCPRRATGFCGECLVPICDHHL